MSEAKSGNPREKSKSRVKKAAKATKSHQKDADQPAAPRGIPSANPKSPFPVFDLSEASASPPAEPQESSLDANWPEPEIASAGETTASESPKRKRRRKKGKGGQQNAAQSGSDEAPVVAGMQEPAAPLVRQPQPPRPKLDHEKVSKLALKIYLAEVSEEGVALIGDSDARELSRRCFRLAEIFIEEQVRHR